MHVRLIELLQMHESTICYFGDYRFCAASLSRCIAVGFGVLSEPDQKEQMRVSRKALIPAGVNSPAIMTYVRPLQRG